MAKKGALLKKEGSIKKSASPKDTAKGQGIVKKKHSLVAGGKRALVQRLEAEAASSKSGLSTKAKARKAKASNAVILGAVDGLKASLDELLAANAQEHLSNTMAAMEEKAKERGGGPSRSKR